MIDSYTSCFHDSADLNTRQAFSLARNQINESLEDMWMRFNTPNTRSEIIMRLEPIFRTLQEQRVLYDYKIICDETNNSPEVIDNHRCVIDVLFDRRKGGIIDSLRIDLLSHQQIKYNNDLHGQVFSEVDPYGEEDWEE